MLCALEHHPRYNELLTQWWQHHSRPPSDRRPAKAEATLTLHQQDEQPVVLDLWPSGVTPPSRPSGKRHTG